MQLKAILFAIACTLSAAPALAWTPVFVCDGGALEVDRLGNSSMYQTVLRGHVTEWFVQEAQLINATRVNPKGEIIQQFWSDKSISPDSVLGINNGKNNWGEVKIALKNAPIRMEVRVFDSKNRTMGDAHGYNFAYCNGLNF
jgi:hypothetical protein